ncbi:hypothetical protein [Cognatishimia sp. MH4019]|uniref:hypothetical protein n=1 Tax=Cognatishimia sp. MH4019 TaxID=2854030 RepID=UPI001CD53F81|nr:hypothetical protein [Cognatishimia sp. MH4019]
MAADQDTMLVPLARRCRRVAAALIGALWPGKTGARVEEDIAHLSARAQIAVVGGVLALLFLLSLFAAQFGIVGLAALFVTIIVVMR